MGFEQKIGVEGVNIAAELDDFPETSSNLFPDQGKKKHSLSASPNLTRGQNKDLRNVLLISLFIRERKRFANMLRKNVLEANREEGIKHSTAIIDAILPLRDVLSRNYKMGRRRSRSQEKYQGIIELNEEVRCQCNVAIEISEMCERIGDVYAASMLTIAANGVRQLQHPSDVLGPYKDELSKIE